MPITKRVSQVSSTRFGRISLNSKNGTVMMSDPYISNFYYAVNPCVCRVYEFLSYEPKNSKGPSKNDVRFFCFYPPSYPNPTTTGLILFTNKRKIKELELPILFGIKLELIDKVKYLRVIIVSTLNWKEHIDERTKKALDV